MAVGGPLFDADDIKRVCAEVSRFSAKSDWTFRAMPVLSWEFASINDFHRAKAELLHNLDAELRPYSQRAVERIAGDGIAEIDAYGATFRLVCKQRGMTRGGPYGAAEVRSRSV